MYNGQLKTEEHVIRLRVKQIEIGLYITLNT
jgi:hypothetical protein